MKTKKKTIRLLSNAVKFVVTGVLRDGRRFPAKTYDNDVGGRMTAFGINLWRGSVWGIDAEGKRFLLKRVYN
jgi:hypothetical protein